MLEARASDTWNATYRDALLQGVLLGGGGLVRAYSTSVSEAVTALPSPTWSDATSLKRSSAPECRGREAG